MEENKIFERINKIFKDKVFICKGKVFTPHEPEFDMKFKFKILGSKPMISIGEWREFVIVDVYMLEFENPIMKHMGISYDINKLVMLKYSIEDYLRKTMSIFGYENVLINLIDKTSDVQRSALVVANWSAIRHCRSCVHTEEHYFFMVVTWNTLDLFYKTFPLIIALFINAIKDFVDNRFDYRTKVCTTHWGCHVLVPFFR